MIDSHELRRRDSYLNKLIGFQDTEPVKVITGIRPVSYTHLRTKDTAEEPVRLLDIQERRCAA